MFSLFACYLKLRVMVDFIWDMLWLFWEMHVTMVRYLEMQVTSGFLLVGELFWNANSCDSLIWNYDVLIKNRLLVELCMFFVKQMKERNVCCCIYHVEIDELVVLYTTCIPNLGFILVCVTSLVKKIVNLQMKSPLNV
jgi:hypothetical protein